MTRGCAVGALLMVCACAPTVEPGVTVLTTKDTDATVAAMLEFLPSTLPVRHQVVSKPSAELSAHGGFTIALEPRGDCTECYRLSGKDKHLTVTGGAPLGLQYGLAHALELFGYRFNHPYKTYAPATLSSAQMPEQLEYSPEVSKRRALHLHTLHPIEGLYDFWEPSAEHLEGARRTIDFVVKNRGNGVQWAALDDILRDPAKLAAWKPHTQAIVAAAHARGVKVGVAIQLLGTSNLQQAFDLVDDLTVDPAPEMRRRLTLLLGDVGFDWVNLSFGEFSGSDPQVFVDRVNAAYDALQAVSPGTEMTATIHVGNYPNLRVTYMGREQLYYFLVRYANPHIVPWIHSVMFYNLFEDAGGAYLHDQFDEHRAFMQEHLQANQPVGYFPESAYWVAFDNPLPIYLPLYGRSRFTDLQRLKGSGTLADHTLFSSGWEWGYWQTDVATLRMTYTLPDQWWKPYEDMFAPLHRASAADTIHALGEEQHHALLEQRLVAYLAGRDQIIDAGKKLGIVSQPDRVEFDALAGMTPADRQHFVDTTLANLVTHANAVSGLEQAFATDLAGDRSEPFLAELADSLEITARRTRFVVALYRAVVASKAGQDPSALLASADDELNAAKTVTARRRAGMFYPDLKSILRDTPNPTFYQYGYLREADQLCFWLRERVQVRQLILQSSEVVPGCVL